MVSREDWTLPRWARTEAGTDNTSNVTAPTSQKQDSGWTSSDVPVREWWNWLLRETGKGLLYMEEWLRDRFGAADGIGRSVEVVGNPLLTMYYSTPGSQQVTIRAGVVYFDGVRYETDETVVALTTQTSQAVMHRMIVAELSGGSVTVKKVDGSVSGTDPTLTTSQIALWRVRQATGVSALDTTMQDDLRVFGPITVGRVSTEQIAGACVIAAPFDASLAATARRYKRKIIPGRAFRVISGGAGTYGATGFTPASDTVAEYGIEEFPPGAILVRATAAYTAADGTAEFNFTVLVQSRLTGLTAAGYTASADTNVAGGPATSVANKSLGDFALDENDMVIVRISGDADVDMTIHSVTIEYIDERPILSFPKL